MDTLEQAEIRRLVLGMAHTQTSVAVVKYAMEHGTLDLDRRRTVGIDRGELDAIRQNLQERLRDYGSQ